MDPEHLGYLIDRHSAALVLFARQWCAAAEDVVQEAFIKIVRQKPVPHQPVAWLYRTVRNGAVSQGRAERRRQTHESRAAGQVPQWLQAPGDPGEIDASRAAEALGELPIEQREAIVAHLWGGLTFEQIAKVSGGSAATIWRRYAAGLASTREIGDIMPENTDNLNPELAPLAEALRSLVPASTAISRDRLLFEAGRAAAARPSWLWLGSTIFFAGLSVLLGAFVVFPNPQAPTIVERERIIEVRIPAPVEPPVVPSYASPVRTDEVVKDDLGPSPEAVRMFRIRNDVLRWGVDMLPVSKSGDQPSLTRVTASDLDRWLDVPPGTFAALH